MRTLSFVVFCSLFILISGCGKAGPAVNPVSGTITFDGKPLDGASVRFTPKSQGTGELAAGSTDASGNLTGVKTLSTGDPGIVAGDYTVTVSKMVSKPSNQTYTKPETGEVIKVTSSEETVPVNYTNIGKSPLSAAIQKGENKLTLEVKK
ncbi:MAG: DUF4198 domain-containing protein [Planctomycetaceae bacterium]|nr:DUF4198 domain-containing protein [Planctomycetaceae bacterium]